jgi:L-fucose mutarotase/ribose pyranase (RbsD/FucU family)
MTQNIIRTLYLAVCLLITTNATAEVYEATPFEPLRTINVNDVSSFTAALADAQPGDDIVLADGVYVGNDSARFFGAFSPGASGTSTYPIRIRAANPGNAHLTIRENPNELGPILGIYGNSHIIVADLVFDAESTAMRPGDGFIRIEDADYIRFENNIINGALPPDSFEDDNLAGLFIQSVTESRIANNIVQNIHLNGENHDGEGIIMYNVNTSVIEFNTTQNIGGVGIYLKGDHETRPIHNFGNTIRYNYATSSQKCLMVSGNAEHGGTPLVTRIYQNVVNDCQMGIRLHFNAAHVDVFNNTAVNVSSSSDYSGMVSVAAVDNDYNNRIWGNLVYSVTQENPRWRHSLFYQTEFTNYTSDYNWQQEGLRSVQDNQDFLTLSESQQAGYELNTVEGTDPFVDFDNGDYRLDATRYIHGSYVPDWSGIFGDYVVPGAYITGNEQIGATSCDAPDSLSSVNFDQTTLLSYGGTGQDINGTVVAQCDTLRLTGNTWKRIAFPYTVTPNTVLELDFEGSVEGDIHGIGFDTDNTPDPSSNFKLYGSQNWGIRDAVQYGGSGREHLTIPVGQYITGSIQWLTFINDHDVEDPTAESHFSNIRVYETD